MNSLLASIPFTPRSKQLLQFIRDDLQDTGKVVSPHPIRIHPHIFKRLLQTTRQWNSTWKRRPFAPTPDAEVCPTTPRVRLEVPSKLFVLHHIATTDTPACRAAIAAVLRIAREPVSHAATLRTRLTHLVDGVSAITATTTSECTTNPQLQWFHVHAHATLEALQDKATVVPLLEAVRHPEIAAAVQQWQAFPDLFAYFVPLDVQHAYETQLHCSTRHRWGFQGRGYCLEVFLPRQSMDDAILRQMCYRITMMSLIEANRCEALHLRWFPSVCQKEVGCSHNTHRDGGGTRANPPSSPASCCRPTATTTIAPTTWNPFQINTGATYRNTCNSVTIWRSEEAGKTFLHEMMHGYGWDFDPPRGVVEAWVYTNFAVHPDTEIRFFESYVETWATILNVYMTVLYYATPNHHHHVASATATARHKTRRRTRHAPTLATPRRRHAVKATRDAINHLLRLEQCHVIFQVAKVLVHSGFRKWEEFFRVSASNGSSGSGGALFQQKTSVFSYFIIRSALLWDTDWFMRHFVSVDYRKRARNRDRYRVSGEEGWYSEWLGHLLAIYRSTEFRDAVDACIADVLGETRTPSESWIWNSMRMTSVEAL